MHRKYWWTKTLVASVVGGGIAFGFVWSALYVTNLRAERRAEMLIRDVSAFRLGVTTINEASPLLQQYELWPHVLGESCLRVGPLNTNEVSYLLHVGNDFWNKLTLKVPMIARIGINPWGAGADLHFKGGKLCSLRFSVGTILRNNGESLSANVTEVWSDAQIPLGDRSGYGEHFGSAQPWLRHRVEVWLSPRATSDDYRKSFSFDLSCLESSRGCLDACELLPFVWLDSQKKARANGWPTPLEEPNARCPKIS